MNKCISDNDNEIEMGAVASSRRSVLTLNLGGSNESRF